MTAPAGGYVSRPDGLLEHRRGLVRDQPGSGGHLRALIDVARADDPHVGRNPQSLLDRRPHDVDRSTIRTAHHRVGPLTTGRRNSSIARWKCTRSTESPSPCFHVGSRQWRYVTDEVMGMPVLPKWVQMCDSVVVMCSQKIDTGFDFRRDSGGKDPDSYSPTLRRYHRRLWSKPLPDGTVFDLADNVPGHYLYHRSNRGEFSLSSDSVIPTFTRRLALKPVTSQLPEAQLQEFMSVSYTIGGMMIYPGVRIEGKQTINGARGFNGKIADRFDLTLECIRRHYRGEPSPLGDTLQRYRSFFELFGDFRGYVDFFLLQDLVTNQVSEVRFFMPFADFTTAAVPKTVETYQEYLRLTIEFLQARNRRIAQQTL